MTTQASYLPSPQSGDRVPSSLVPELSRRARGFAAWAMLKKLGRHGVATLVERHCSLAAQMAERLAAEPDIRVLNDVVLNQVAVEFGADEDDRDACRRATEAVIEQVQADDRCYVGGAAWQGRWIMRISVISCETDEAAAMAATDAILAAWETVKEKRRS